MMTVNKILIIKPSALGDIIHTIPIVSAIKKSYNAKIYWVVSRSFKNILENSSVVDHLYIFERKKWAGLGFFKNFKEIQTFISTIRKEKFDIVIDFQGLLRSGVITILSNCSRRIGFKNARELASFCYTKKVITPPGVIHAIDRYKLFAYELGINKVEMTLPINISSLIKEKFANILPDKYITIVPGARWPSKRWPPEYFSKLIDLIYDKYKIITVIIGAPDEIKIGNKITPKNKEASINLIGKTSLVELVHVLQGALLVISNDSGPMHLSAALNIKTIAIFGPTDPDKIRPYGDKHHVVKKNNLCACYYQKYCSQNLKCLRSIQPNEIIPLLGLQNANAREN